MPIEHTAGFAAVPAEVLAVLTDEAFLREYAAALGARVERLETVTADGGRRTVLELVVPTRGVPPVFARFVGQEVRVTDRRTWAPADAGVRGLVDVGTEVFGRAVRVRGERRLAPGAEGTRSTVTGEAAVDAPVVGRQAEAAVRELALVVLRREDAVLRRRLGTPA